ncbi:MAG: hypothetical protein AB1941_26800 [Gemmatimonadota bacterium]
MGIRKNGFALAALLLLGTGCADEPTRPDPSDAQPRLYVHSSITYNAASETTGWMAAAVTNGQVAGTVGQAQRMTGLRVDLAAEASARVCYQAFVGGAWQPEVCGNGQQVNGTLPFEAVRIRLENAPERSVCYEAHVQNRGWLPEVCDGQANGLIGQGLYMEAVRIRLAHRPASSNVARVVTYEAHLANDGWIAAVSDGAVAGTTGLAKQMEALRINLSSISNGAAPAEVCYTAYVQGAWQPEVCGNGQMVGTTGLGARMEGLKVRLRNAGQQSICYEAHVENVGWQDQVCDGAVAGVPGWRMEAVRIRVRNKFYAWTNRYTGAANGIPLLLTAASVAPYGQHESQDRQHVWAGNWEKYFAVDEGFVIRNKDRGFLYIIGDEPDHWSGALSTETYKFYSPAEYAKLFHDAVNYIRARDPSARFSNGGFTHPGATPLGTLHFTAYADEFISEYKKLANNQEPPIAEWRYNFNGLGLTDFNNLVTEAVRWGRERGGKKIFVGSFDGGDMASRIAHINSYPTDIVGAAWWMYDATSASNGAAWPWALSDLNGDLVARGHDYRSLTQ